MSEAAGLLFTAFEPSGDTHAAAVIAALRASRPNLPIWAFGGPKMSACGAYLIEQTTDKAVMLAGAAAQFRLHRARLRRLRAWLDGRRVGALIPVDSPAANWSICRLIRRRQPQAKIVHLIAPQLWAWAPWRIGKLRRLTNHVLCLLPFEPPWFDARGVPASFVGHPTYARSHQHPQAPVDLPDDGHPKLALLPGSRAKEIRVNWPTMLDAYRRLSRRHTHLAALVAAADDRSEALIRQVSGCDRLPAGIGLRTGQIDAILDWADAALVVSGTATLDVAAAGKPMVILFNTRRWMWHLAGRWIIQTRTFTLPNLIAQWQGLGRIVPELVPHFGQVDPVVQELDQLLTDPELSGQQQRLLAHIAEPFRGCNYAEQAARHILEIM